MAKLRDASDSTSSSQRYGSAAVPGAAEAVAEVVIEVATVRRLIFLEVKAEPVIDRKASANGDDNADERWCVIDSKSVTALVLTFIIGLATK